MVNGISVFLIPLNEEFGWQRGSVSLINLSGLLGLAAGGILMGRLADRTTTRRVCMPGCVRVLTPLSRRASALGIVTLFAWLGHGIGGYQGGFFFDLSGDYYLSYANAAAAGVVNLIIVGSLYITINRRRAARRCDR